MLGRLTIQPSTKPAVGSLGEVKEASDSANVDYVDCYEQTDYIFAILLVMDNIRWDDGLTVHLPATGQSPKPFYRFQISALVVVVGHRLARMMAWG